MIWLNTRIRNFVFRKPWRFIKTRSDGADKLAHGDCPHAPFLLWNARSYGDDA